MPDHDPRAIALILDARIDALIEAREGHDIWTGLVRGATDLPIHRMPMTKPNVEVQVRRWLFERKVRKLEGTERIFGTCGTRRCVSIEHMSVVGYREELPERWSL